MTYFETCLTRPLNHIKSETRFEAHKELYYDTVQPIRTEVWRAMMKKDMFMMIAETLEQCFTRNGQQI